MPTRVLLLRHAESADPSVFHGAESDVGLSEHGRRQAERVAAHLAPLAPAAVVSSAMRRALATADAIARACGVAVHVEPLLHERRMGPLSGTPKDEGVWPVTLGRWLAGDTGFAPEGTESFDGIRARVLPVWERILAQYAGQTVVVVAHGVVIRVLLVALLPGYTVADWQRLGPIHNVAVHELLFDGAWRAVRLNDLSGGWG